MANFVFNEVLSGVVDGVNKTFTSIHLIDTIEDLRVGWADYTDFSYSQNSKTVVLADAPSIWMGAPSIDYFIYSSTQPSDTSVTLGMVIDDFYVRVGQDRLSRQYPLTLVTSYIKEGIRVINNQRTNRRTKIKQMSFNKAKDCIASGYSATSVNVWTIPSYTPSAWKLIIQNSDVINYTTTNATSFNWISELGIVYNDGAKVSIGYLLPTTFKHPSEVIVNSNILYPVDKTQFVINPSLQNAYTIIDGYLFLPYSTWENDVVTVWYVEENYMPSVESDKVDISPDYYHVLSLYALWNILSDREDDRARVQREKYDEALRLYKAELRNAKWINFVLHSSHFNNI